MSGFRLCAQRHAGRKGTTGDALGVLIISSGTFFYLDYKIYRLMTRECRTAVPLIPRIYDAMVPQTDRCGTAVSRKNFRVCVAVVVRVAGVLSLLVIGNSPVVSGVCWCPVWRMCLCC